VDLAADPLRADPKDTDVTTAATRPRLDTTGARRPRDARRYRRLVAAALLPLPALCITITRPLLPDALFDDTRALLDDVAAHPAASRAAVWLGTLAMLTMVPAILAAVRLARRRRPRLATAAAGVNLAAYLGAGLGFTAFDGMLFAAAGRPPAERAAAIPVLDAYAASGVYSLSIALFVFGHVAGMVLLGLALRGSVPGWASLAITVSQPLHFVCFVILQNLWLDAAAWSLAAIGLAVCAVVVLRTPDDEWDLPPRPALTTAGR
jgi:hypothetical protein